MNIRKTSSGRFEARMMINGVRYTSTQPTLEDAVNWLKVLQAQEVTGGLPGRIIVPACPRCRAVGGDTSGPRRHLHHGALRSGRAPTRHGHRRP